MIKQLTKTILILSFSFYLLYCFAVFAQNSTEEQTLLNSLAEFADAINKLDSEKFSAFIAGAEKWDCVESVLIQAQGDHEDERLKQLSSNILSSAGFKFKEYNVSSPDTHLNLAKMDAKMREKIHRTCVEKHFSSIREFEKRGVKILKMENFKVYTFFSVKKDIEVYRVLGDLSNLKSIFVQEPKIFYSCVEAYYGVNNWTFKEHLKRIELSIIGSNVPARELEQLMDEYFNSVDADEMQREYHIYLKEVGEKVDGYVPISLSMPHVLHSLEKGLYTWQSSGDWSKPEEYVRMEEGMAILPYDTRELLCVKADRKWKFTSLDKFQPK